MARSRITDVWSVPARARLTALLTALLIALALPLVALPAVADPTPDGHDTSGYRVIKMRVAALQESEGAPVGLDTRFYRTAAPGPVPLVALAHGFGGSLTDMEPLAQRLAGAGYDVAIWSARGFGASEGLIHLDDPNYEVADVSTIIDAAIRAMDNVERDAGDPVVAVAGVSYGGAVALMAAAQDHRIDAVVPIDTWNDLASAFFPDSDIASPTRTPVPALRDKANPMGLIETGPLKQQWVSRFLGSLGPSTQTSTGTGVSLCGRMVQDVCQLFLQASDTGRPSSDLLSTLRRDSPAATLDKVVAPVLLIQGVSDSLFGLDQADATARALAEHHVPVWVRWTTLGHDTQGSPALSDNDLIDPVLDWLNQQLRPDQATTPPTPGFVYPLPDDNGGDPQLYSLPAYPGIADPTPGNKTGSPGNKTGSSGNKTEPPAAITQTSVPWREGQFSPATRSLVSPPGGQPASTLGLPAAVGGASAAPVSTYPLAALPGQSAAFDTVRLDHRLVVVGSPQVRIAVGSTATDATLFVSLWQVNGDTATMPRQLVAPVRVNTPTLGRSVPTLIRVALPASTYVLPAGSVWRVLITTTDAAFANPRDARAYMPATVQLGYDLTVPAVTGARPVGSTDARRPWRDGETLGVAIAIVVVAALGTGWLLFQRRGRVSAVVDGADPVETADVPLLVHGLRKTYHDGHRAVDGVDLRAERGQIVGLLGPNGAGKTTVMRMLMGLIRPDAGTISVLGERVRPGAAVLRRVGALVEGPGFLPHLTGRQNLAAYWDATGRPPQEAHLADVLAVAALGGALDRPVRSYSQGMRQRLGIAQAMLGLPELLILDEPTNGLDPPQIAAMRPMLQEYAAQGRTVLVSSHLLAEVELTCSHVVVMREGRVVIQGAVTDLLAETDTIRIELGGRFEPGGRIEPDASTADGADVHSVAERLLKTDGVTAVSVVDDHILQVRADLPRGEVVAAAVAAGASVIGISAQRHLEEVFLTVIDTDDPRTIRTR